MTSAAASRTIVPVPVPTPVADPLTPGPAPAILRGIGTTERLTRLLYLFIGAASAIFWVLSIGEFYAQVGPTERILSVVAWLLVFGLPVVMGILSRWAPLRVLAVLAVTEGVVFVAILTCWLIVAAGFGRRIGVMDAAPALPEGSDIPWILSLTGVPSVAVAIVSLPAVAWGYAALVSVMSGVLRAVSSTDAHPVLVGFEDSLYSILLLSVFVGLTLVTRQSAARVEVASLVARASEARRAAGVARKTERLSINALVHDSVMSTLLMAGLGRAAPTVVARQALETLRQLDGLRAPRRQPEAPCREVQRRLGRQIAELAPDAILTIESCVPHMVPYIAAEALVGAVGEALRNSVASAGQSDRGGAVGRTVTVNCRVGGMKVVVRDDGIGFDPALVPTERLGIAQSIIGRMQRIPHGAAEVRSRPGDGTEVIVSWTRE